MKRAVFAVAIGLIASPLSAQDVGGGFASWLSDAFEELCFKPFGSTDAVRSAVEAFRPVTEFQPVTAVPGRPQTGATWETSWATLTYTDASWLPRDLPSPQCRLTADLEGFDYDLTVKQLGTALPIGVGKQRGKGAERSTQWDFTSHNGAKRRMFLAQERGGRGNIVTVSLLNLRK